VFIIDRRFALAGAVFAMASAASLCGLIHSPLASGALVRPWAPPSSAPLHLAGGYGVAAALCCLAALRRRSPAAPRESRPALSPPGERG
jgi:hypothetical protein